MVKKPPPPPVPVHDMDLVGGDVCLDLANTANRDSAGEVVAEKLGAYEDLVTWAERVRLVGSERAARLRRAAAADPVAAERALDEAKSLRELVFRVFSAEAPGAADLLALSEAAGAAAARRRLEPWQGGYVFAWPESDAPEQVLWPVALSAAELLVSADRERVKQCAGETCEWLFVDRSRNRSRRWCDMKDCGNRAKARRFQAKQRRGS